jgi:hypothetical protein
MFRGGRVDSRGTGITSGLGYEKGGRVGYFNGGSIYDNIAPYYTAPMPAKSGTGIQGIFQGLYDMLNPSRATIEQRLKEANPPEFGPGSIEPFIKTRSYTERKEEFEKNEAERLEKEKQAEIQRLLNEERLKNSNLNKRSSEPSSDDLLDIDKEKFAELLGGDKARGEDISNMLMSFAGKALKPEATVKGAFGEFFEEESKRPSSKTKVDQAAAQLAINKYIKGEISKAELAKLIAVNKMKTDIGDAAYIADALQKSQGTGFVSAVKSGLQRSRGGAVEFVVTDSESMSEGNFEPGAEDIGKIFIEKDTKKVYEFNTNYQPVPIYSG